MNARRRLFFAVTLLCFILLLSASSVGVVMATLNAQAKQGIFANYSGYDISASVSGCYFIENGEAKTLYADAEKNKKTIEFDAEEEDGVEKSFEHTGEIELNGARSIYFHYQITNKNKQNSSIYLYADIQLNELSNMGYYLDISTEKLSQKKLQNKEDWSDALTGIPFEIKAKETAHIYLKFFVLEDTQNAYTDGNVLFVMTSEQI
ncbi:MAG: hypothetical protein IJD48_01820 [Clostridia bacterium]|nr:hypothetical protein [Clostridia bacterium]